MKRPVPSRSRSAGGFTLIEILVATTLSLLLLGAVVWAFADIGGAITNSRSMLEMAEKLRLTGERLQMDLAGATAIPNPPLKPENNQGYIEIIKGPIGSFAVNTDNGGAADPTVGNIADILMLTTRSTGRPFVGRYGTATIQSDVAEVAWFIRGRTLHRRVLLVGPGIPDPVSTGDGILEPSELWPGKADTDPTGFYADYDISVRAAYSGGTFRGYIPNTLGDLTRRECRFAHSTAAFPFLIGWSWSAPGITATTLPTLDECSSAGWTVDKAFSAWGPLSALDFWTNNATCRVPDNAFIGGAANHGSRIADDIILTNVIGFDVKVWDPALGIYVDLGNSLGGRFSGNGSRVGTNAAGAVYLPGVYDTWSTHYESVAVPGLGGTPGQSTNGLDNNTVGQSGYGIVNDDSEKLTSPPYPYPLRGIQVKIRTFEPDSKQIREVTVVQDFLPQ